MLLRINWLDSTPKSAWSHTDFLGKNQFKADRNTCLLRSSPKLDLCLTSAFSKDDAEQETHRKWIWLPWAEEFPILWELVSKKLEHNQGKIALIINKQILKKAIVVKTDFFLHFTKRTSCNGGKRLQIMQDYLWQQHFMLTASTAERTAIEVQCQ